MLKGLSFKVFSLGLLGLIGLLVVGGIYSYGNSQQTTQVNLANGANIHVANALRLKNALLSARVSEKDFLLNNDQGEIDRHAKIAQQFEATSREIETVARRAGGTDVADAAKDLRADFASHNQEFQRLFKVRSELGLKPDQGLEGALRGSVHDIEKKLAESNNADLTADMLMMRRHEKDFMLRKDDKYIAQMKDAAGAFSSALSSSALSDDVKKQIKGLAEAYLRNFAAWSEKSKDVDKLDTQLMSSSSRMEPVVDFIVDAIDKVAKGAAARQQAISSTTTTVILISIAVAALIVMLLSWLVGRAIVRPLRLMTNTMTSLAGGNLNVVVEGTTRGDEIGSMAKAVEIFKANAIDNRRMEQEVEENRKRGEAERIAMQQKAEADAAERLRIATAGLAAGLKRLASGDLSFQLNEAFSTEFEALRHDFNQSVSQLGSAMKAIAQTVSIMDDGTREIASGADDLSRRTEQQAASLEETAAAVEEITSNVANSTTRAQEARTVANRANESAVKSAQVVSQTEDAMREIETSSQKISNIIGVIDEIAFQTNLLALNAGVEAARAGEAGKGFAVVAQEVRELAQRAAGAAKEIKSLIQNSSSQVENGVKLVRGTSEALKQIGDFIVEMNSHMESIATSAMEQSTGLKEVNEAVNAMDQTTQQNAAMVEQSNAASMSLAQEAARLRELVGQFQLEVGATQSVAALRQTAAAMAQPQRVPAPAPRQMSSRSAAAGATRAQNWEEF